MTDIFGFPILEVRNLYDRNDILKCQIVADSLYLCLFMFSYVYLFICKL